MATIYWLTPSARLAMYRSLIRDDREAALSGLQTEIGALLSRPETCLCRAETVTGVKKSWQQGDGSRSGRAASDMHLPDNRNLASSAKDPME
jgi:hypothetical protein